MSGNSNAPDVLVWSERAETLHDTVASLKGGRRGEALNLVSEISERLVNQERDIDALMTLLMQEKERTEALRAAIDGGAGIRPEWTATDAELEKLRDYALGVRLREIGSERRLNTERFNVASLEARLAALGQPI